MKLASLSLAETAPQSAAHTHPAYRADIDGLRAIAVLSVVLFHAFPARLPGGFAGVDIFFIISGYLIGSIIIGGLQADRFSFADFYARRIRRIFPALSLVLAACLAFGWFGLFADEYKMLGKHVAGGAGFLSNFFLWNEVGYFDTAAETKPLLHLWSLGIEEQFYIFWPLILCAAWKLRQRLLGVAVLLALASFAVNVAGLAKFPSATFYSPASRAWELLLGAMLAYFAVNKLSLYVGARRPGGAETRYELGDERLRHWASLLGLGLLVATLALLRKDRAFPGWWALLPTGGALLLIAAGPGAWVNRRLLACRPLVWVGLISYPLYLWHWPLLSFAQIIESGLPSSRLRGALLLLAVLLAWLTYRFVERPLRGGGNGRAKVGGLLLVMLALAGAGAFTYYRGGLPQRGAVVENALLQKDLILVEDLAKADACKARYGFVSKYSYCLLDDVKRDPSVVLIGDSHGYHHVAGLSTYYRSQGENLWFLGTRVPFLNMPVGEDPYQQATPQMLDLAINTPGIKTVIISTALKLDPTSDAGRTALAGLRETFRQLLAHGRDVVFINDVPQLDFEPRSCIPRGAVASTHTRLGCELPARAFRESLAVSRHAKALAEVLQEFPQVQLFDAAAQLCDAQRCQVMVDGMLMYRDTHHLSYRGDLWMGERFAKQQAARRHQAASR